MNPVEPVAQTHLAHPLKQLCPSGRHYLYMLLVPTFQPSLAFWMRVRYLMSLAHSWSFSGVVMTSLRLYYDPEIVFAKYIYTRSFTMGLCSILHSHSPSSAFWATLAFITLTLVLGALCTPRCLLVSPCLYQSGAFHAPDSPFRRTARFEGYPLVHIVGLLSIFT